MRNPENRAKKKEYNSAYYLEKKEAIKLKRCLK
jgi:hypothetical protein